MALHVLPINDIIDHEETTTCHCRPSVQFENGEMIIVHNSYDGREKLEHTPDELSQSIGPICLN